MGTKGGNDCRDKEWKILHQSCGKDKVYQTCRVADKLETCILSVYSTRKTKQIMKKVFIAMALLVLLLALPFRSMIVEAVTASTETIEDVREGDVIFPREGCLLFFSCPHEHPPLPINFE